MPSSQPRFPVEQWTLANGLRVVIQPDPGAPLVALAMCYAAGSSCDPPGRSGLAHLCEHLAFHGPRPASGQGYLERVSWACGLAKAATSADRVCFSALLPSDRLAVGLEVEAERSAAQLEGKTVEALEIQRSVLLQELQERSGARTHTTALETVNKLLFPKGSPYHDAPAGTADGIRSISAEEAASFFASHYRLDNAVLVLAGDLSATSTAELVRRCFEDLPAGAAPAPARPQQTSLLGAGKRLRIPAPLPQARLYLAWSLPGWGQEEWYLTSLLARGLAIGRSSPLFRELVEQAGLAREVHCHLLPMRDASVLVFTVTAAPGVSGSRLEEGLLAAVDRLLAEGLSEALLLRAQKRALTDYYYTLQHLDQRAELAAAFASDLGAPERLETEPLRYSRPVRQDVNLFSGSLRQAERALLAMVPQAEAA